MLRTQIYLPQELRKEIDKQRSFSGESLADYIRKATEDRLAQQKNQKKRFQEIIQEAIQCVGDSESGWNQIDILKWQKEIREDRN